MLCSYFDGNEMLSGGAVVPFKNFRIHVSDRFPVDDASGRKAEWVEVDEKLFRQEVGTWGYNGLRLVIKWKGFDMPDSVDVSDVAKLNQQPLIYCPENVMREEREIQSEYATRRDGILNDLCDPPSPSPSLLRTFSPPVVQPALATAPPHLAAGAQV
jgi:hypothetical protein